MECHLSNVSRFDDFSGGEDDLLDDMEDIGVRQCYM